jgi:alcohol dehydrogenase (cytochrome c)
MDPICAGSRQCHSISLAPLVVKNRVIVGTNGGEGKVRGSIVALDADSGREIWRFHTIPGPTEVGHDTWPAGDAWRAGGGPVWNTGTYDPELNLTYWGIGNPSQGPDGGGDLLYTESVVALDADTGTPRWHYQFTPHDEWDWDATQVPVLADLNWQGQPRKLMLFANRNGVFYVLDRSTGQFLLGKPYVEVNWVTGFDPKGRPQRANLGAVDMTREFSPQGILRPGAGEVGATNWYPPSFDPASGLIYVPAQEYHGAPQYGALRAIDPLTGERKWEFKRDSAFFKSGALTTASGLVFTGVLGQGRLGLPVDGQFYALDARTGELLWQVTLPRSVQAGAISYSASGKQYIAVMSGTTLFAFALR